MNPAPQRGFAANEPAENRFLRSRLRSGVAGLLSQKSSLAEK
jgi:hypothetical protein